jgi:threonine synthase
VYDYEKVKRDISREKIESRPKSLWRYRELLPIEGEPRTGHYSGYTPLVKADRLAKSSAFASFISRTTQSTIRRSRTRIVWFRWRPLAPSSWVSRCFGCASTGNLANSVSAHAARLGLQCFVFIPHDLEASKFSVRRSTASSRGHQGNYDDVNRLCTQIAEKYGWGFANINLRQLLR